MEGRPPWKRQQIYRPPRFRDFDHNRQPPPPPDDDVEVLSVVERPKRGRVEFVNSLPIQKAEAIAQMEDGIWQEDNDSEIYYVHSYTDNCRKVDMELCICNCPAGSAFRRCSHLAAVALKFPSLMIRLHLLTLLRENKKLPPQNVAEKIYSQMSREYSEKLLLIETLKAFAFCIARTSDKSVARTHVVFSDDSDDVERKLGALTRRLKSLSTRPPKDETLTPLSRWRCVFSQLGPDFRPAVSLIDILEKSSLESEDSRADRFDQNPIQRFAHWLLECKSGPEQVQLPSEQRLFHEEAPPSTFELIAANFKADCESLAPDEPVNRRLRDFLGISADSYNCQKSFTAGSHTENFEQTIRILNALDFNSREFEDAKLITSELEETIQSQILSLPYCWDIGAALNWESKFELRLGTLRQFIKNKLKSFDQFLMIEIGFNKFIKLPVGSLSQIQNPESLDRLLGLGLYNIGNGTILSLKEFEPFVKSNLSSLSLESLFALTRNVPIQLRPAAAWLAKFLQAEPAEKIASFAAAPTEAFRAIESLPKEANVDVEICKQEEDLEISVDEGRAVIEDIQRNEFQYTSSHSRPPQAARLARAVHRLADDLYADPSHAISELIQNADDNEYPECLTPALVFILTNSGLTVLNNEKGFSASDVRALSDVGRSSKKAHQTGKFGIGFKAVFKITNNPHIFSRKFRFMYQANDPSGINYLLPRFLDIGNWDSYLPPPVVAEIKTIIDVPTTVFWLPFEGKLSPETNLDQMVDAVDFRSLLILRRLNSIRFVDLRSRVPKRISARIKPSDLKNNVTPALQRALLARKDLCLKDVEIIKDSQDFSKRYLVAAMKNETTVCLPLSSLGNPAPLPHPLFNFLPIRHLGLSFLLHSSRFNLVASREALKINDVDNQKVFAEVAKNLPDLLIDLASSVDFNFLKFAPVASSIASTLLPWTSQILQRIRQHPLVPSRSNRAVLHAPIKTLLLPACCQHNNLAKLLHQTSTRVLECGTTNTWPVLADDCFIDALDVDYCKSQLQMRELSSRDFVDTLIWLSRQSGSAKESKESIVNELIGLSLFFVAFLLEQEPESNINKLVQCIKPLALFQTSSAFQNTYTELLIFEDNPVAHLPDVPNLILPQFWTFLGSEFFTPEFKQNAKIRISVFLRKLGILCLKDTKQFIEEYVVPSLESPKNISNEALIKLTAFLARQENLDLNYFQRLCLVYEVGSCKGVGPSKQFLSLRGAKERSLILNQLESIKNKEGVGILIKSFISFKFVPSSLYSTLAPDIDWNSIFEKFGTSSFLAPMKINYRKSRLGITDLNFEVPNPVSSDILELILSFLNSNLSLDRFSTDTQDIQVQDFISVELFGCLKILDLMDSVKKSKFVLLILKFISFNNFHATGADIPAFDSAYKLQFRYSKFVPIDSELYSLDGLFAPTRDIKELFGKKVPIVSDEIFQVLQSRFGSLAELEERTGVQSTPAVSLIIQILTKDSSADAQYLNQLHYLAQLWDNDKSTMSQEHKSVMLNNNWFRAGGSCIFTKNLSLEFGTSNKTYRTIFPVKDSLSGMMEGDLFGGVPEEKKVEMIKVICRFLNEWLGVPCLPVYEQLQAELLGLPLKDRCVGDVCLLLKSIEKDLGKRNAWCEFIQWIKFETTLKLVPIKLIWDNTNKVEWRSCPFLSGAQQVVCATERCFEIRNVFAQNSPKQLVLIESIKNDETLNIWWSDFLFVLSQALPLSSLARIKIISCTGPVSSEFRQFYIDTTKTLTLPLAIRLLGAKGHERLEEFLSSEESASQIMKKLELLTAVSGSKLKFQWELFEANDFENVVGTGGIKECGDAPILEEGKDFVRLGVPEEICLDFKKKTRIISSDLLLQFLSLICKCLTEKELCQIGTLARTLMVLNAACNRGAAGFTFNQQVETILSDVCMYPSLDSYFSKRAGQWIDNVLGPVNDEHSFVLVDCMPNKQELPSSSKNLDMEIEQVEQIDEIDDASSDLEEIMTKGPDTSTGGFYGDEFIISKRTVNTLQLSENPLSEDVAKSIGRAGELFVYHFLKEEFTGPETKIVWVNQHGESGFPYDMVIEHKNSDCEYIEVKATRTNDKSFFEISRREWLYAQTQGDKYQIYRVFNVGNIEPRIIRIINPYRQWRNQTVSMFFSF